MEGDDVSGDHNMYCSGNQPDIVDRLRIMGNGKLNLANQAADEIERLREGLALIECEPINAEYMARNILDGKPAYHDTMIKVGAGGMAR
jgi:hypothetical protein